MRISNGVEQNLDESEQSYIDENEQSQTREISVNLVAKLFIAKKISMMQR